LSRRGELVATAAGVPAMALAAWAASTSSFLCFVLSAGFAMPLHELGHATMAWLCGRAALPFFFQTLAGSPELSWVVFPLVVATLAWGAHRAWHRERKGPAVACAALVAFAVTASLTFSDEARHKLVLFAGCGAELWGGATLVLLFFEEMPYEWRWPTRRWFFLAIGMATYVMAARRWATGEVPWGSFVGGDGDMDLLRDRYGWSEGTIVWAYRWVAAACGAAMLVAWGRATVRAWTELRAEEITRARP